ncbi:MAG: NAD(P)(+) transhydrogenase (Re/Si-specific) subunit alpha, partial [Pelagibacteraceae bacterium]|nr:NAD(P)(+) transhydrogenase (Re/Si-specific) subunit alpha [Pelagibacteraceae bacterium]
KKYSDLGFKVTIEKDAGLKSGFSNENYKKENATISGNIKKSIKESNIIIKVQKPESNTIKEMKTGTILISLLSPKKGSSENSLYNKKKISAFALENIPRITRAQDKDVLSSQSNLAGYKAVLDAAHEYSKSFPMMMTAAGTVTPAKVLVLGAGVAGLQAIATAKRLGAVVSAYDIRLASKEEVESLGAKFIVFDEEILKKSQTEGGYAKEMSAEYKKKQEQALEKAIPENDIIICTALIPNKAAPRLITKKIIEKMKSESVIVDLAVESGGNAELSEVDKVINHKGVKIVGYSNYPSRIPGDASTLFSKNVFNFIKILIDSESKKLNLNLEDEIISKTLISHQGKLMNL